MGKHDLAVTDLLMAATVMPDDATILSTWATSPRRVVGWRRRRTPTAWRRPRTKIRT
ncbi:MAG: hypothetical protein U1F87_00820 [Kiritimatiellia bacterium]